MLVRRAMLREVKKKMIDIWNSSGDTTNLYVKCVERCKVALYMVKSLDAMNSYPFRCYSAHLRVEYYLIRRFIQLRRVI